MLSSQPKIELLPWLPRPTNDFRSIYSSLMQEINHIQPTTLENFAKQFLSQNQLNKLSKMLISFRKTGADMSPLISFKLGLVSNATVDFIKPCLEASALRYGIDLEVITTDFGQLMQEALNPESKINQERPDAILIALDHRGLPFNIDEKAKSLGSDRRRAFDFINILN